MGLCLQISEFIYICLPHLILIPNYELEGKDTSNHILYTKKLRLRNFAKWHVQIYLMWHFPIYCVISPFTEKKTRAEWCTESYDI